MTKTWADFIKDYKDWDEYDKGAMEIAHNCKKKEDKIQVFKKMTEAQPLIVVWKSAVDGAAQYLFNFFKMGNSILERRMKYVAMIGFGKRSTAVLVDPNALFRFLTTKKTITSFEDLLQTKSEEDYKNLKRNSTW